jgi:hypothetical protein
MYGNDVLLGPRKVKIVRTVIEFVPCPEAGPGRWQASYVDVIVEEAVDLAQIQNVTAEMLRALSLTRPRRTEPVFATRGWPSTPASLDVNPS